MPCDFVTVPVNECRSFDSILYDLQAYMHMTKIIFLPDMAVVTICAWHNDDKSARYRCSRAIK